MMRNTLFLNIQTRRYCSKGQHKLMINVQLDEKTDFKIKEENLKFRKHPGVIHRATLHLPEWINSAAKSVLSGYNKKDLKEKSRNLYNVLNCRLIPPEQNNINERLKDIKEKIYVQMNMTEDLLLKPEIQKKVSQKAKNYLNAYMNHWKPINFDKYHGVMYLVGRSAQDYTVLYKILSEIKNRDPEFKPKTLLDFGSGIGTVSWVAAELWNESLQEYVCIDSSEDMNTLAKSISSFVKPKIKNIFYRQHFPYAPVPTFDIVVSSYTTMELPSRKIRVETLYHLWQKTNKYLVLVEQGTNAGFQLMDEARSCILNALKTLDDKKHYEAHIFSPCPHELNCPRLYTNKTPCNFEASFFPFPLGKQNRPLKEKYSYIVFKKGKAENEGNDWPRIIRPVLNRSNHTICRMCTAEGNLKEIIFTKNKFERNMYRCARASEWGDRLPMKILPGESSNEIVQSKIVDDFNDDEEER